MANDIKWEGPTVALTTYLDTALNSQGNNVIKVGAAINNSANRCTHMDLEVTLNSINLSAEENPAVNIYMFESVDGGTDYETNEDGVSAASDIPTADKIIAIMGFRIDTGAESKLAIKSRISIPPGHFKLGIRNVTGQGFNASGNTLAYRTYNLNSE